MASSSGYGGSEEQYMAYHVPQQSRREKLRYSHGVDPSIFHLHHNPNPVPPFHHTAAAHFFPSSPSSSSSHNPNNFAFYAAHPAAAHQLFNDHHPHQIPTQQHHFSLSLSSSSASPRQQQLTAEVNHPASLGPFTGYAEILNRSRFLEPARLLLEEVCGVVQCPDPADRTADVMIAGSCMELPMVVAAAGGDHNLQQQQQQQQHHQQQQWKKTKLISMLDEVHRRYKLYYQQVQTVIASFESVPGLSSAAPYAFMALKVMSNHFRCLKNAISDQLHHINKAIGKEGLNEDEHPASGLMNRQTNNYGTVRQPHVWRPQRGLPERAVAVLRSWLFEHFLHPYPSDSDKQMLAKQTGLTRNQVSNWFINARVRLWKPMVEEIHSLEMGQQNKAAGDSMNHNADKQAEFPSSSTATSSNDPSFQNTSNTNHNQSSKRPHNELIQMPHHIQEPNYNLLYDGFPSHHNIGIGGGLDVKGNGGVSLTLGLHQNNGICLADALPLNVVRRFGLEECSDPYVMGSFGGQDRQFDKDIGGHLLHDFVG